MELHPGLKRPIRVKTGDFCPAWPWNLTHNFENQLVKLCTSFPSHRLIGVFVPCDLEIWRMTLKNNKAPLLHNAKQCALFQSHRLIQTWVTARKRSIRVKTGEFLSRVTFKFDRWPWKSIEHLFYTMWNIVYIISKASVDSNWSYSLVTLNSGQNRRLSVPCVLKIW